MAFDPDQLATLAAVVTGGTFDAAARTLRLTPSAVSQRVRALEREAGQVLVLRTRPCRATAAGEVLIRLAGQLAALDADAHAAVGGGGGSTRRLPVAVNADSLATWFVAVLTALSDDVTVDVHRADQDRTAQLLRDGTVMAAVTGDGRAVQGCRSVALGAARYRAMAAPAFAARHLGEVPVAQAVSGAGPVPGRSGRLAAALGRAPVVAFTAEDALQRRFVAMLAGGPLDLARVHHVPSSSAYVAVIAAGLGWGMVSEQEAAQLAPTGALVDLAPGSWLDVPLWWQRWAIRTTQLDELTDRVVAVARAALQPVPPSARRHPG